MRTKTNPIRLTVIAIFGVAVRFSPNIVSAYCDTLAGPVVITAKAALEKDDITPVLKWGNAVDQVLLLHLSNANRYFYFDATIHALSAEWVLV